MQKTMLHLTFVAVAALAFAGQACACAGMSVPLDVPIFAEKQWATLDGVRVLSPGDGGTLGGIERNGACGLLFGERVCVFPMRENANENLEGKLK